MLVGEIAQRRQAHHGAVVVRQLRDDPHRRHRRQPAQVDGGLSVTCSLPDPSRLRHQGEHMTGPGEVSGLGGGVGQDAGGRRAICRADSGGESGEPLGCGVAADRIRRAFGVFIRIDHGWQAEIACALPAHRHADDAGAVADRESHQLRRRVRGSEDQVPFVLPVGIVDHDHRLAPAQLLDGDTDRVQHDGAVERRLARRHAQPAHRLGCLLRGCLGRPWLRHALPLQHPVGVLGEDVDFDIDGVAEVPKPQCRLRERRGDQTDLEPRLLLLGFRDGADRERDAVDRDGTLLRKVFRELSWHPEPVPAVCRVTVDEFCRAIHVPLDHMAVEPLASGQAALEIHPITGLAQAQRGPPQGLGDELHGDVLPVRLHGGDAHPVDGDGGTEPKPGEMLRGGEGELLHPPVRIWCPRGDGPLAGDDSSEHRGCGSCH